MFSTFPMLQAYIYILFRKTPGFWLFYVKELSSFTFWGLISNHFSALKTKDFSPQNKFTHYLYVAPFPKVFNNLGNRKKPQQLLNSYMKYYLRILKCKLSKMTWFFKLSQRSFKQKESQNIQHIMIHQTTKLTDQFLCSVLCQLFSMKIFYNSGNYLCITQNTPAGPKQVLHWWIIQ